MAPLLSVNIASPAFKANQYPFYARLRAEMPVVRVTLPDKRVAWLVTRYDAVFAALRDQRLVKDRRNAMTPEELKKQPWVPGVFKTLQSNMLTLDEGDHRRLRGLVQQAFTPRILERMRERVEHVSNELLDAAQSKRRIDL